MHSYGGFKEAFDVRNFKSDQRYLKIKLIEPAQFRFIDGKYQILKPGIIEVSESEPEL